MKNIAFSYAHGPDGPFQSHARVVVRNKSAIALTEIRERFERRMINKNYFLVEKFGFPSRRPIACDALSNDDWHELVSIEETSEAVTEGRDVSTMLLE